MTTKTILPTKLTLSTAISIACLTLGATSQAAIITVTNTNDNGAGSLRQAILDTNAGSVADTIDFNVALDGSTITLSSGQMDISDTAPLIIDASALSNGITIDGNNASRIFGVTKNQKLTLNNLTVTRGQTTSNTLPGDLDCATLSSIFRGGAICTEGEIELVDTTISNSRTTGDSSAGGGFFTSHGDVILTNSTISNNSTSGRYGTSGGFAVWYDVTLINSTFW